MNEKTDFRKIVKLCIMSLSILPISIIIAVILFFISDGMYIDAGYMVPQESLTYKIINIMFELIFPINFVISSIFFVRINSLVKHIKGDKKSDIKIKLTLGASLAAVVIPVFLTVFLI